MKPYQRKEAQMTYDLVRWASHLSIILAVSLGACFMMFDDKRHPLALLVLALAIALAAGTVMHTQDGNTWVHHFLSMAANG